VNEDVPEDVDEADEGQRREEVHVKTYPILTVKVSASQDAGWKVRAYFSVQLIPIFAVLKSKCAVEKSNVCTRGAKILVKMMIYAPITRFCAIVNP